MGKCAVSEDLRISCDWISFTFNVGISVLSVIRRLGFTYDDFRRIEKGSMGYRRRLQHYSMNIQVIYDGNENMGVHLVVSGSAISFFVDTVLKYYRRSRSRRTPFGKGFPMNEFINDSFVLFLSYMHEFGKFTRFDIAIDDLTGKFFSMEEIVSLMESGRYVSKFRCWKEIKDFSTSGKKIGHTVNVGSRTSDVFLRIYDKRLEQGRKGIAVSSPWIRWELELHGSYSDRFVSQLCGGLSFASLAKGILSHYFRFIELTDKNKSRCPIMEKWSLFIGDVEKIGLYVAPVDNSLSKKERWFDRQVVSSLSALFVSHGGSIDWLNEKLENGWRRAPESLRRQAYQIAQQCGCVG